MTLFTFILLFVISIIIIVIVFYVVSKVREQIKVIEKEIEEQKRKEDIKLLYELDIAIKKMRQMSFDYIEIYQVLDKAEKQDIKLINKLLKLKESIEIIQEQIRIIEEKRNLL